MATYKQIQAEIKKRYGYSAVTGWIAHVKEHHGLTTRIAHNRINSTERVNPCPPEKWTDIEAVLQSFGMIEQPKKTSPFPRIRYVGGGRRKAALTSTDNSPWYWLIQQAIFHDSDSANKEPAGWHWLILLHYLLKFNVADIQKKLPDSHPLKSASLPTNAIKSKYKPTINEFNRQMNIPARSETTFHIMDFCNLIIEDPLRFSNFIFPIKVEFIHSQFSQKVSFNNTVFLNDVFFTNAVFSDTANFENAEFHGRTANFRDATFEKEADFEKTTFKNYANFKGATFADRTIFQLAKFELHAPRFYGAIFNNEIILNRIKLPDAKKDKKNKNDTNDESYEKRIEENKSAYETLIHLMEKQNKHHERHRFFREEMRWRQLGNKLTEKRLINAAWQGDYEYYSLGKLLENSFTIAFFWLYDTTSEYGHGIGRAFGWWLLHIILGAIAIFIIASCAGLGAEQALFCSASTSSANANPFVFLGFKEGGLMDCYKVLHYLLPIEFGTIRGVQTFIGIPLLFILLTTLRVRFRIK